MLITLFITMAFFKYVSIDVGPGRVAKIKKNYTYVLIFLIKLFQIGQKVFIFAGDFFSAKNVGAA